VDEAIKLLLEAGTYRESKHNRSCSPLLWAAQNRYKAVVKLLLEAGANVELKDKVGRTPLSWAAQYGERAVVKAIAF
jgi:ankyrin repeat protein